MKLSRKIITLIGVTAAFGLLTVPAMSNTTIDGSLAADQTRDQLKLKDGSCVPAVDIVTPILAADQLRDRIQDKLKDGSCLPAVEIVTPVLAADKIRQQLKDGSCVPAVEIVAPTLAADQLRDRIQDKLK
ncbi:MAG: hypothetical protein KKI15_00295, partial [Proteobacteria bacterium]|nr:hypothetical protein [Pseudomonadota bacterium]